jgi:hypothetical protein
MTARPTEAMILILSLVCVLVSIIGCQTKEAPTPATIDVAEKTACIFCGSEGAEFAIRLCSFS